MYNNTSQPCQKKMKKIKCFFNVMARKTRMRKKGGFATAVRKVIMNTAETKRNIESLSSQAISTTVHTLELTDIATGDGSGARDGNEIYVRSVGSRYTVGLHASATASVVRFVLYTPRDADSLLTTLDYIERIDPEKYVVWADKLVTVNTNTPVKVLRMGKKWYTRKVPGMKVIYDTGAATGSTYKNPVVMAIVSNEATNTPTVNGDTTLYYKDP